MTARQLIDETLPGLLVAGIVAFFTMTYQFAQMRVEIDGLRRDVGRVESTVAALINRSTYWKGNEEIDEITRLAKAIEHARQTVPGSLEAAEK